MQREKKEEGAGISLTGKSEFEWHFCLDFGFLVADFSKEIRSFITSEFFLQKYKTQNKPNFA